MPFGRRRARLFYFLPKAPLQHCGASSQASIFHKNYHFFVKIEVVLGIFT
jgi:hypothetical protein